MPPPDPGSPRPVALVVGASGHLGRHQATDWARRYTVVGTSHRHGDSSDTRLDVTDPDQVSASIDAVDPRIVVLISAVSNVAFCEEHPSKAAAVNVGGVRNIVRCCADRTVVFFSTDAVFDGSKRSFTEDDEPNPLSVYGRHKLEAEQIVRGLANHLIIRTARFYSRVRGNGKFIDQVMQRLAADMRVAAPVDTPGNPTFLEDLSRASLTLFERGRRGTYHVAGPRAYSLYETAVTVAAVFGWDESLVIPVPRDHGTSTPRITSGLDTRKVQAEGIRLGDLRENLIRIRDGT